MHSHFAVDRRWLALLTTLALHSIGQAGTAEGIFLIEDDVTAIHLSDHAQGHASRLLLEADSAGAIGVPCTAAPACVNEIVRQAAQDNALDPYLLHAVIAVESGYAGHAVSPRGALGLMQLMPATARSYGVTDAFDAQQNVSAGARHLRSLLDQFGQDVMLALAAYNAGADAVARHGRRVPPFAETMSYVPRVLRRLAQLHATAAPRLVQISNRPAPRVTL